MSFDGDIKQWKCGKGGPVNLQRVSSIVRDIGELCVHQSPIKVVIAVRLSNLSGSPCLSLNFFSILFVNTFSVFIGLLDMHLDFDSCYMCMHILPVL